ncbi:MAG TPA: YajQ family cyclic di-GMP-binding protein [Fibrobacteria bacterium]|nr:YajQ family cyclic di-GMP-binding protein [Fibrobacteria bacterium]HOX51773.1 YajQ family cyclic di-GMP-binding protein [Fibrobacteria bacterium]
MAKDCSFDVVSKIDPQEVRNAVDQARREVSTRFDFKGSKCEIDFDADKLKLTADDEPKLEQLKDVLDNKLIKRGVSTKGLEWGKIQAAGHMTVRQEATLKAGIPQVDGKKMAAAIKDSKIKVQASILGDHLRVTGKSKDDLQEAMALLRKGDWSVDLQFTNFQG